MARKTLKIFASTAFIGILFSLTFLTPHYSQAQDQWSWPEKAKNLQVLLFFKDLPGSRLKDPMVGFTRALGVGCSHCHVGEEGKPLSTYDFTSDANPNKDRAREMIRMLGGTIDDHLAKIKPSGDKPVNMWCHTCHRGRPRPMTIEEELGEVYRAKGIQPALNHYAFLKKNFYGRGAYDFGERALNNFGHEMLENKDAEAAIRIFAINTEAFPKSATAWNSLAKAYLEAGNRKMAEKYYRKSLSLDPRNQKAREMLKKLKAEKEESGGSQRR